MKWVYCPIVGVVPCEDTLVLPSNGWCYKLVFLHFNLVLVENNTNINCECYALLPETGCEIRSLCLCLGRRPLTLIPLRDFISCDRYFWGNLAYVRVQKQRREDMTSCHITSLEQCRRSKCYQANIKYRLKQLSTKHLLTCTIEWSNCVQKHLLMHTVDSSNYVQKHLLIRTVEWSNCAQNNCWYIP